MRLDNFDLNLLVAFNVLMEEQNVTKAANRLNVTQSAMSAALRRLREAFQDQILVPQGKKMVSTSHAQSLAPEVSRTLIKLRALISETVVFDPATSRREFHIAASDYITMVLIDPLLPYLEKEAPNIILSIGPPSAASTELLADGKLDFILTPEQFLSNDHPKELLFNEKHVVVGWKENPIFKAALTEDAFLECGHVVVNIDGRTSFVEDYLTGQGYRRKIEVRAASFSAVPWMLPNTHRLALMHERLANVFLKKLPLAIVEPPFHIPAMKEMVQYSQARTNDGGVVWLLEKFLKAAKSTPFSR